MVLIASYVYKNVRLPIDVKHLVWKKPKIVFINSFDFVAKNIYICILALKKIQHFIYASWLRFFEQSFTTCLIFYRFFILCIYS